MPFSENAVPLVAAVTPLEFIAALAVGLRLYVRVVLLENPGLDDWLCIGAQCCSLGAYLSSVVAIAVGFGSPLPSMALEDRMIILKALWISPGIWGLSSALVKMSIVSSYMRIWSSKPFVWMCYALLVIIALFGLALFLGSVLACVPVQLAWAPQSDRPRGACRDMPLFMFVASLLNTILDLLILAIPIPLFQRLQLPKKQRLALTVLFTIGAVVCISSIMRLVCIRQQGESDPSANGIPLATWSGVENELSIICACLPILRPAVTRMLPKLVATVTNPPGWNPRRRTRTFDENGTYRMRALASADSVRDNTRERMPEHGASTIQVDTSFTVDIESAKPHNNKEPRSFFDP
ncbi:hypothetical protein F4779DRAFT_79595 [Xylariaceae sp. FL0662B]|nr:hypothetical protein F4779DRAFT_79595 [Xylariaceae sp. FL0662B]